MSPWRHVKAVLWSFIGIGRRADAEALQEGGSLLVLVAVAFVLLLCLAGTLLMVARYAAGTL
jgi:hypothetical protein